MGRRALDQEIPIFIRRRIAGFLISTTGSYPPPAAVHRRTPARRPPEPEPDHEE